MSYQDQDLHQELDGVFSCCKKKKKNFQKDSKPLSGVSKSQVWELVVAVDQGRSSLWTQSYHMVVVVSFLLKVAIEC